MKVVITGAGLASYWYAEHIGEVFDVTSKQGRMDYWVVQEDYKGFSISPTDCVQVTTQDILQEQLQAAKDAVADIEKQLAEEAEKEASRPFTQAEYEAVVKQFRACEGRKKFDHGEDNFGVKISAATGVSYDNYSTWASFALFGVWFSDEEHCINAIEEVGKDNLTRAWEYEMSIGL